ncbi:hypothetical protein DOTSEDRAFT_67493 [Dothistroma septosporum NZE10]|uniref:Uncharacterized protein n=1 Tax=Dothistroma septosporum (strain NZE10 / CBS 128990) TaxID=675120 RepID=N1PYG3_DOTSN|nr:hypothetical protein DOTSEDRAFT_67493 [Dothistroma septosporum NZE10]
MSMLINERLRQGSSTSMACAHTATEQPNDGHTAMEGGHHAGHNRISFGTSPATNQPSTRPPDIGKSHEYSPYMEQRAFELVQAEVRAWNQARGKPKDAGSGDAVEGTCSDKGDSQAEAETSLGEGPLASYNSGSAAITRFPTDDLKYDPSFGSWLRRRVKPLSSNS